MKKYLSMEIALMHLNALYYVFIVKILFSLCETSHLHFNSHKKLEYMLVEKK